MKKESNATIIQVILEKVFSTSGALAIILLSSPVIFIIFSANKSTIWFFLTELINVSLFLSLTIIATNMKGAIIVIGLKLMERKVISFFTMVSYFSLAIFHIPLRYMILLFFIYIPIISLNYIAFFTPGNLKPETVLLAKAFSLSLLVSMIVLIFHWVFHWHQYSFINEEEAKRELKTLGYDIWEISIIIKKMKKINLI